jgi:putative heme-binding domain-containing protein
LDAAFEEARVAASNPDQPDSVRGEAIELLALSNDAPAVLAPLALEEPNQSIRLRAIAALAKTQDIAPWRDLLRRFANETPALQGAILDGVFGDPARTRLLLEQIAAGRIAPTALDATRVNRLLNHRDDEIKRRAQKLLADAVPTDRRQALAEYRAVLTMKAEPARGRAVFQKQCANCHRIDGLGVDVAPDISDSREKSAEQILADIIQPNRAIDSNYFSYTAVTVDGRVHTGILTAETSTSVTLKQAEGKAITLRRAEIDELYSNGVSLMPDGMEKLIPPQDMADLISFIKNWRYLDGRGESVLQLDAQRAERAPGQK